MNSIGYVKLFRKFQGWEWYQDTTTKAVFIELLLTVNYQDRKWKGMVVERGQVVTSLPKIAKALKLSIQQVRTALKKLESTGDITDQSTRQWRVVTLCNFDDYNSDKSNSNRQINRPSENQANQQEINGLGRLTESPKTDNHATDRSHYLTGYESTSCESGNQNSNRRATDKSTDEQQTSNRPNKHISTDKIPAGTLLERGNQPVGENGATDEQQTAPWQFATKSTDNLTATKEDKEDKNKEKNIYASPKFSSLKKEWEKIEEQVRNQYIAGKSISENSATPKPSKPEHERAEQPVAKAKRSQSNPQPVPAELPDEPIEMTYQDELPIQAYPGDLLDWEKAIQTGDTIGALGFRIAMKPEQIMTIIKTKKIDEELFELWLLSRAARNFETGGTNPRPIDINNWFLDLTGYVKTCERNAKQGKKSHHKAPVRDVPTTKDQIENWRELCELMGWDHTHCDRLRDLDVLKFKQLMKHPEAKIV